MAIFNSYMFFNFIPWFLVRFAHVAHGRWPFQEAKSYMVQYLLFRILKFPLTWTCLMKTHRSRP